jgi:hypothetical protein
MRFGPPDEAELRPGDEVVEHIPWDRITVQDPVGRSPLRYAAVVGFVVLAAYAIWQFQGPDSGTSAITLAPGPTRTVDLDSQPSAIEQPVAAEQGGAPSVPLSTGVAPSAQLTSEADLMAFVPIDGADAARVRAEWFVLDYFSTADGDRSEKVSAVVPEWADVPVDLEAAAYVDWVHAYDVEPQAEGRFDVRVAYRSLVTADDGPYVTGRVRAVMIPVDVRGDGASAVSGLPTPISAPATLDAAEGAWIERTAPEDVVAAALDGAAGVVDRPTVVRAVTDGATWRVVLEAGDDVGLRWPFEVLVELDTDPVPDPDRSPDSGGAPDDG